MILEYGSTVEAAEVRGLPSSRARKRALAIVVMLVAVAACVAAVGIFTPANQADELEVRKGLFVQLEKIDQHLRASACRSGTLSSSYLFGLWVTPFVVDRINRSQ